MIEIIAIAAAVFHAPEFGDETFVRYGKPVVRGLGFLFAVRFLRGVCRLIILAVRNCQDVEHGQRAVAVHVRHRNRLIHQHKFSCIGDRHVYLHFCVFRIFRCKGKPGQQGNAKGKCQKYRKHFFVHLETLLHCIICRALRGLCTFRAFPLPCGKKSTCPKKGRHNTLPGSDPASRHFFLHFTVSAETRLPLPMYLTYPSEKGFTVTDSPGFSPDSMLRISAAARELFSCISIVALQSPGVKTVSRISRKCQFFCQRRR